MRKYEVTDLVERQQLLHVKRDFEQSFISLNNNPRLRKVYDYVKYDHRRGKLLDIGCSTGHFAASFSKLGFSVYGLELDGDMVKTARAFGIKVKKGSFLKKLPYKNSLFDVIFAGEVVEHTVDDDLFLKECCRIIKNGGLFILTTPNLVSLANRIRMMLGFLPKYAYEEYHYRIYNLNLLKGKMKAAGFSIHSVSSSHVMLSRYWHTIFNKIFGLFGEVLGTLCPTLGEQFIIYAIKE